MVKNVLVTGGAGFIGTNLVRALLGDNTVDKVIVVDNFITSSPANIREFSCHGPRFEFFRADVSQPVFQDIPFGVVDEIYHLASIASPILYAQHPIETLDVSYLGTKNVLELARAQQRPCKVLLASTSEVYGDPKVTPQCEDYYGNVNCYGNRSCYDVGKRMSETLCHVYAQRYAVDVRVARIFNTYGPGMNIADGRIIPSVIQSVLGNKPITIFGDGEQTRCFNYVDDTITGLVSLMRSKYTFPVNIGSEMEMSVNSLVDIVRDVFATRFPDAYHESELVFCPIDKDDPKIRKPDLAVAKRVLDYRPRVSIRDGLEKTILFFLQR